GRVRGESPKNIAYRPSPCPSPHGRGDAGIHLRSCSLSEKDRMRGLGINHKDLVWLGGGETVYSALSGGGYVFERCFFWHCPARCDLAKPRRTSRRQHQMRRGA